MKFRNEKGNAVVEFILLGLMGQLIIFGFLINVGATFRSQIAAESIGRQVLRSFQLHGTIASGQDIASQIISIFGLPSNLTKVSITDNCNANGTVSVAVKVREKSYSTKGFCLG